MEKQERIKDIQNSLKRIKEITDENSKRRAIKDLFIVLGVNEKIINNPNPQNLGVDIDFSGFIESINPNDIKIEDDGSLVITSNYGSAYLVKEGRNVGGIETSIYVSKEGTLGVQSIYDKQSDTKRICTTEMVNVENVSGSYVRTRTSDYVLATTLDSTTHQYQSQGSAYITISDYDENGIQIVEHDIIMSNSPALAGNRVDTQTIKSQLAYLTNVYTDGHKLDLLPINSPILPFSGPKSAFSISERFAQRIGIDKNVIKYKDKSNIQEWKVSYGLPLTGEHDLSMLLNNCETYTSEEELEKIRQVRLDENWYDKKIEYYVALNTPTGNAIAEQLTSVKEQLEQKRNVSL